MTERERLRQAPWALHICPLCGEDFTGMKQAIGGGTMEVWWECINGHRFDWQLFERNFDIGGDVEGCWQPVPHESNGWHDPFMDKVPGEGRETYPEGEHWDMSEGR